MSDNLMPKADSQDLELVPPAIQSPKMRCCRGTCADTHWKICWALGSFGLFFFFLGGAIPPIIRFELDRMTWNQLIIDSPQASDFHDWNIESTPAGGPPRFNADYYNLHFFHVRNPDAVLKGAVPDLEEKGPYAYRKYTVKYNITWTDDGDLMTFREQTFYVFDSSASGPGLSDSDNITNVNLALLGVRSKLQSVIKSVGLRPLESLGDDLLRCIMCNAPNAPGTATKASPFQTRSVKELFWGYQDDPTLSWVVANLGLKVSTDFPAMVTNMTSEALATDKFSTDTIHTGKKDRSKIWKYVHYQNMSSLHICESPPDGASTCPKFQSVWGPTEAREQGYIPTWGSDAANAIEGSDGSQFARPTTSRDVTFLMAPISRTGKLKSGEGTDSMEVVSLKGIDVHRYRIRDADLLNATHNPENEAYYMHGPDGVFNMTKLLGLPIFVTLPHFVRSDPLLVQSVKGLRPDRNLHDTWIDVSPYTGVAMSDRNRLQFNVLLEDWGLGRSATNKIPPQVAADEHRMLSSELPPGVLTCLNPEEYCSGEQWQWNISSQWPQGLFLPWAWVGDESVLTDKEATIYKNTVLRYQHLAYGLKVAGLTAGSLCVALLALHVLSKKYGWYRRMCGSADSGDPNAEPLMHDGFAPE